MTVELEERPTCGLPDVDARRIVAGIPWRQANSLITFNGQMNARFPNRSKLSDGSIGDAAHASRSSDHNPWVKLKPPLPPNVVTARDTTHDPAHGVDISVITDQLVASRDPRIKYLIANGLFWQWKGWVKYTGPNPHRAHFHLSVVSDARADDGRPWNLPIFGGSDPIPPKPIPVGPSLMPGMTGPKVQELQRVMRAWYPRDLGGLVVDGVYGPATRDAVAYVQKRINQAVDGIAGPQTLAALKIKM